MKELVIHQSMSKGLNKQTLEDLCPFAAIACGPASEDYIEITAACKMCGLCVKNGPAGVFELIEIDDSHPGKKPLNKEDWKGIAVYIDQVEGEVHPVSFELIGKARELAAKVNAPVYALCMGSGIASMARQTLLYGVDKVFVYDQKELEHFRIEPYTAVFEDFINEVKPSVCLVGGTTVGRSLAPRTAARFRTGLTADCTFLDIKENTDLDQIRPAFGGNIMAHIHTPAHRPQFATVRYKIFSAPEALLESEVRGVVEERQLPVEKLSSRIEVLEVKPKVLDVGIEEAEVIVVAGRGVKKQEDLKMLEELASSLGGQLAATRSLIEAGWADPRKQIGLSGRTVKPRLIITCGVSGAIQFVAGMNSSELIIAINTDAAAPIMKVAHIALEGDLYEILPFLLEDIKSRADAAVLQV
ncbi:electron transfer flavoprotein subunit alpha/FixB family protein [Oceanispirochaeta sp.]|jgi:electron transfer flavoprotein alpha subunit|uniref:electron transfer flavoprotein subunit alpha/FixB family protein n=1 Tax=Oceanispirochaeta sp. TaxID=2035350 RepID=UPI00261E292D|nr:electron transfer flavoprotein subunit alpha/FixB family protein [Oceanispirochaeta sp.]MDA3955125.1 electron transfer flavoprotein subunit alpha/FixB family protein [Oceanispirochaeta sp.]